MFKTYIKVWYGFVKRLERHGNGLQVFKCLRYMNVTRMAIYIYNCYRSCSLRLETPYRGHCELVLYVFSLRNCVYMSSMFQYD